MPVQASAVFGPRIYERDKGAPVAKVDNFSLGNSGGTYLLKIYNGGLEDKDDDNYDLVSSSIIYLNGIDILGPNELNQKVKYLEKLVTVQSVNEISVEVRGKIGGALALSLYEEEENDEPVVYSQKLTTPEDTPLSIVLVSDDDEDDDDEEAKFQILTQPVNGVLSGVAPNLTYTPNLNFNGTDSFTFSSSDGHEDSDNATVNITVTPVNDLAIANDLNLSTDANVPVAVTLSATDIDTDSLSYRLVTQPTQGVISGTAPNLTYTPNATSGGVDSFTYVANDGVNDSNIATVSITVNVVNGAPKANNQSVFASEDAAISITLSGTDPDADVLTYQLVLQPVQGILTGTAPTLTYTPNANYNGQDSFEFKVSDGVTDSAIATVSIDVAAVNDLPVAVVQTITTNEDTAASLVLKGSDVDGDLLTYSISTQPLNGVVTGIAPNLTYTPNANFNGIDTLTYVANDGLNNSAEAAVTFTVNPVNDVPVVTAQTITTNEDVSTNILLTGTDVDGDTLTYSISTQPLSGVLSGALPNLTYVPNANFNGTDSFTVVANDGLINSAITTITINVTAANDASIATAQTITVNEDLPTGITLSGTDIDNDALVYTVSTQPANGVLT